MPIRLSGKEIARALAKDGWTIERVSGSHHVMRHPDGYHVSVPVAARKDGEHHEWPGGKPDPDRRERASDRGPESARQHE